MARELCKSVQRRRTQRKKGGKEGEKKNKKNPHNSCRAAGDGADPLWHSTVVPSLSYSSCFLAGPHSSHARTARDFPCHLIGSTLPTGLHTCHWACSPGKWGGGSILLADEEVSWMQGASGAGRKLLSVGRPDGCSSGQGSEAVTRTEGGDTLGIGPGTSSGFCHSPQPCSSYLMFPLPL